jgi:hypothetical protein
MTIARCDRTDLPVDMCGCPDHGGVEPTSRRLVLRSGSSHVKATGGGLSRVALRRCLDCDSQAAVAVLRDVLMPDDRSEHGRHYRLGDGR